MIGLPQKQCVLPGPRIDAACMVREAHHLIEADRWWTVFTLVVRIDENNLSQEVGADSQRLG